MKQHNKNLSIYFTRNEKSHLIHLINNKIKQLNKKLNKIGNITYQNSTQDDFTNYTLIMNELANLNNTKNKIRNSVKLIGENYLC